VVYRQPARIRYRTTFFRMDAICLAPADWGGPRLMDALLPTLYFGHPSLALRTIRRERALRLWSKYRVRNTSSSRRPEMMMKACRRAHGSISRLRSMMTPAEAVGTTVFYGRRTRSADNNEMFGQTGDELHRRHSHTSGPQNPGRWAAVSPAQHKRHCRTNGEEAAVGELGEVAVNRTGSDGTPDPVFSSSTSRT